MLEEERGYFCYFHYILSHPVCVRERESFLLMSVSFLFSLSLFLSLWKKEKEIIIKAPALSRVFEVSLCLEVLCV